LFIQRTTVFLDVDHVPSHLSSCGHRPLAVPRAGRTCSHRASTLDTARRPGRNHRIRLGAPNACWPRCAGHCARGSGMSGSTSTSDCGGWRIREGIRSATPTSIHCGEASLQAHHWR
jgi:hypothetical protein